MESLYGDSIDNIRQSLDLKTLVEIINNRNDQGITPLNNAIIYSRRDVFDFLLEHGANVNVSNQDGKTPMMIACIKNNFDMAHELLVKGSDLLARDNEENRYIYYLLKEGFWEDKDLNETNKLIRLLSMGIPNTCEK